MSRSALPSLHTSRRRPAKRRSAAFVASFAVAATVLAPTTAPPAAAADVGQGFTITTSDLAYILKQIKIAEAHVANTTSETGPCGALIGTGPNQIASPLVSAGLRTVDGSCNNLVPGKERIGAADEVFPRLTNPEFKAAEPTPAGFGPPGPSSYAQKKGNVFDTEPRVVSNLVVDQTSTNPAAIAAAGFPVRTQGNPGVQPCTTDPDETADPPVAAVPAELHPVPRDALHPERDHRRRPLAAVQLDVHAVRPVLRPRHRPDRQGRRHGLRPAEGRRPADRRPGPQGRTRRTRPAPGQPAVHGAHAGQEPARSGRRPRHRRRHPGRAEHGLALGRPEPDLHVARVPPGLPARVRERRGRPPGLDRQAARGARCPRALLPPRTPAWPPGRTRRPRQPSCWASSSRTRTCSTSRCSRWTRTGGSSPVPSAGCRSTSPRAGRQDEHGGRRPRGGRHRVAGPGAADVVTFETPFLTDIAHNADPSPQDTDHNPGTPPVAPGGRRGRHGVRRLREPARRHLRRRDARRALHRR